jgi:UDP-N-acetylglucosamine 2-epimerase (non-hydrolysing)
MLVTLVAGARPNFMKIAPIIRAIHKAAKKGSDISYRLVHTGQHYDRNMSGQFFEQLEIPTPHANLEVGSGTQAEQTAGILVAFEKELMQYRPDLVLVVGDVTSTMACSIAAKKLNIKVAHVEAGIRSWDLTMPEEINRMVTDAITDYFFTTTSWAGENLLKAGASSDAIYWVGNTMIDTLYHNINRLQQPAIWQEKKLEAGKYLVATLHRPSNVDNLDQLLRLLTILRDRTNGLPVVFPIHPRTAKMLSGTDFKADNIHFQEPMGYLEFNYLVKNALGVITDSGGITEETTVMHIPCITLRDSTERPETVEIGTNELVGTQPEALLPALEKLLSGNWKKGSIPPLWDGQTADRIVAILQTL